MEAAQDVYALRHIFNLIRSDKISKRSYISTVHLSQYLSGMTFQNSEHDLFQAPQSPFFILSRLQKLLSRMLNGKNYIHVDSNFVIDFSVSDTQLSRLWAKQCCKNSNIGFLLDFLFNFREGPTLIIRFYCQMRQLHRDQW